MLCRGCPQMSPDVPRIDVIYGPDIWLLPALCSARAPQPFVHSAPKTGAFRLFFPSPRSVLAFSCSFAGKRGVRTIGTRGCEVPRLGCCCSFKVRGDTAMQPRHHNEGRLSPAPPNSHLTLHPPRINVQFGLKPPQNTAEKSCRMLA